MTISHSPVLWVYRLLRWIPGLLFLYAGCLKLSDPVVFATLIDAFGILPEPLLTPVSICLPVLEILAGLGLLTDMRGAVSLSIGLLLLFILVLAYALHMGLDIDCGCFGPEDPESKAFHGLRVSLYRDLAMLLGLAAIYGFRYLRGIRPRTIRSIYSLFHSKEDSV